MTSTNKETHQTFQVLLANERCPKFKEIGPDFRESVLVEALTRSGFEGDFIEREFDGHYPEIEATLKAISSPPVDRWVLLSGKTGSGKTSLLANMSRRLFTMWALKTNCPAYKLPSTFASRVRFIPFSEFRDIIRVGFDDAISAGAQGIDLFKTVQLLIIDDMIDGDNKPYDYLRLYDVIRHRYDVTEPRLPIWISTNVSADDMKKIPELERSYSRLADTSRCQYFELTDKDRRP